jgi:Fe2+ or Zn2+ uptake regulation protein
MDELGKVVENAGFALKNRQLELDCLCEECSA